MNPDARLPSCSQGNVLNDALFAKKGKREAGTCLLPEASRLGLKVVEFSAIHAANETDRAADGHLLVVNRWL